MAGAAGGDSRPATLDRVRALTDHPAFSMANPNRVRALIGSFAQVNHTQFNRADRAGYDFVADAVLTLDLKNPQVAARLMGAFRPGLRSNRGAVNAPKQRYAGDHRLLCRMKTSMDFVKP